MRVARAAKQGLRLEGFLVRSMASLRGLIAVAALVAAFALEKILSEDGLLEALWDSARRLPKKVKVWRQPILVALQRISWEPG